MKRIKEGLLLSMQMLGGHEQAATVIRYSLVSVCDR